MKQHFIPADGTIADLKKQADDFERRVAKEPEPLASELREKAKLLLVWIEQLRSGKWTAFDHSAR